MEISIPIEQLKKSKLFVATPMYGGVCHGPYTQSLMNLTVLCMQYGIQMQTYFLFNESLITRARNYCADEFMRSDCTHLLFIDSDIGFEALDALILMGLQSDESEYDVIAGPYPKKNISWEKIVQAVNAGAADKNANALDDYTGDYVFNPVAGTTEIPLDRPVEVLEAGTGFMMIRKSAFEKYRETYPQFLYKPDHVRTKNFDGTREIMAYFDVVIDPDTKRYLSEDYMFCQNVRKMGGKVWLCPWMKLTHTGSYIFKGNLEAIASIGAAATVDMDKLKNLQRN
jgi:hypothetical protein